MLAAQAFVVPEWIAGPALTFVLGVALVLGKLLLSLSRSVGELAKEIGHIHLMRENDRHDREIRQVELDANLAVLHTGQLRIHDRIDRIDRIDHIAGWSPPAAETR